MDQIREVIRAKLLDCFDTSPARVLMLLMQNVQLIVKVCT